MGCNFHVDDDYERCEDLIEEYKYLLDKEDNRKVNKIKKEEHNKEKENLRAKIKNLLEKINEKAEEIAEINQLQRLNQKYQILLTEDSKMQNNY